MVSWRQERTREIFNAATQGSTSGLRATNKWAGGIWIYLFVRYLLVLLVDETRGDNLVPDLFHRNFESLWNFSSTAAATICLFPPLFFFYGLYYTDVLSTISFLLVYYCHLKQKQNWLVIAGLASLGFRQTNVFWSGVFLGSLELCRTLPRGRPDVEFPRRPNIFDVTHGSWNHSCVYDPPISAASLGG